MLGRCSFCHGLWKALDPSGSGSLVVWCSHPCHSGGILEASGSPAYRTQRRSRVPGWASLLRYDVAEAVAADLGAPTPRDVTDVDVRQFGEQGDRLAHRRSRIPESGPVDTGLVECGPHYDTASAARPPLVRPNLPAFGSFESGSALAAVAPRERPLFLDAPGRLPYAPRACAGTPGGRRPFVLEHRHDQDHSARR